eukprot:TRINITY_DN36207_c0_g1_i1.p1 TRINITY_DN36207_c0_g1~~TRINITY_DN36207_c0_g1_i1.p1  ORF type:complete len:1231 (-),score=291.72 TRINITY_DN36207_c0_g1_i1:157-3849(-)
MGALAGKRGGPARLTPLQSRMPALPPMITPVEYFGGSAAERLVEDSLSPGSSSGGVAVNTGSGNGGSSPSSVHGCPCFAPSRSQGHLAHWARDRHTKDMRSTFIRKLTREQQAKKTLPQVAVGLHSAAAAIDHRLAVKEMRRCSSNPTTSLLDGLQMKTDMLPPVLGLNSSLTKAHTWKPVKLDPLTRNATVEYLRSAYSDYMVPNKLAMAMAQTRRIDSEDGDVLTEADVAAVTSMIPQLDKLTEVRLLNSRLIGCSTMIPFLKALQTPVVARSLTKLCLRGCSRLGVETIKFVTSLLTTSSGLPKLQCFDMSGVLLHNTVVVPFCEAIGLHPQLHDLQLSNCGIGLHQGPHCVESLLACSKLQTVDLSWNRFSAEVYKTAGDAVVNHGQLQELYLENATCGRDDLGEASIGYLLESLSKDKKLRVLDVRSTMIGPDTALVLEDALQRHPKLEDLRLDNNPLGAVGMQSIMRLVMAETTPCLLKFSVTECRGAQDGQVVPFCYLNPGARYQLDLARPYHRAVLRQLHKACDRFGFPPDQALKEVEFSGGALQCSKDRDGVWSAPEEGTLSLLFKMDNFLLGKAFTPDDPKMLPTFSASKFLDTMHRRFRMKPPMAKATAVLTHFRKLVDQGDEQRLLLEGISHDMEWSTEHIHSFCSCVDLTAVDSITFWKLPSLRSKRGAIAKGEVLARLLHTLGDAAFARNFALISMPRPRLSEFLSVRRRCEALTGLNPDHATGKYNLSMSNPADFAVAEALWLVDRWESANAKEKGRTDTSMYGNWTGIRNCYFNYEENIVAPNEWRLPAANVLAFDYVSWRRLPATAQALPDDIWASLLGRLCTAGCSTAMKIQALRDVAHMVNIRAMQLREVISIFMTPTERVSVFVLLLHRIVDPQHLKMARARISGQGEWETVRSYLGYLNCHEFWQPDRLDVSFDMSVYEERMTACLLVQLAYKEHLENIREPQLLQADGTSFDFLQGVPPAWATLSTIPEEGKFSFQYRSGPETRDVKARSAMGRSVGGWQAEVTDKKVCWWTIVSEASESLRLFVKKCMKTTKAPMAFFQEFAEHGAVSSILSRSSFETGIKSYGWTPFDKDPELSKVVFRLLDPENNGEISKKEWGTVVQLWQELELCTLEFLKQLARNFDNDLEMALGELDADGSGAVDLQEWMEAAKAAGYSGPAKTIFQLVANSIKGPGKEKEKEIVDAKSCAKLREFWEGREALYRSIVGEMR